MKKFDLEKALTGAKVVTRNGLEVTQLHKMVFRGDRKTVLLGVIDDVKIGNWNPDGLFYDSKQESHNDLFMAHVKVEKWINLLKNRPEGVYYDSKEEAMMDSPDSLMATVKVEWEE